MDELHEVLQGIAEAIGASQWDVETDHGRWYLYENAIRLSVAIDLVQKAVMLEVDKSLATSVVLRMLEQVPDDRQADWIDLLAPENRAYSERRATETRILRRARDGVLPGNEVAVEIGGWTDWLQLRLASTLSDREGLEVLSSAGRTKRIRNTAKSKLRSLLG